MSSDKQAFINRHIYLVQVSEFKFKSLSDSECYSGVVLSEVQMSKWLSSKVLNKVLARVTGNLASVYIQVQGMSQKI